MKKILIALAAAIFVFASCSKTENPQPKTLKVNLTVNHEGFTKAVKTGWESGDKVYVFFGKPEERPTPAYLCLTYNGSDWNNYWSPAELETQILGTTSGTMTAVFVPGGIGSFYYDSSNKWYSFSSVKYSYYMNCDNAEYTVSGGVLNGTLNMKLGYTTSMVYFYLDGVGTNASNLTLSCPDVLPIKVYGIGSTGKIFGSSAGFGDPIQGFPYKEGAFFSGLLRSGKSGVASDYTITIVDNKGTSDTSDDKTYTLTKNRVLVDRGAYRLPALSSTDWTVTP
ncbi:MAG: hypothetical protein IJK74_02025 [Bacteroidales bacterium]|nr:hypothetical protein [Bacteroidales bacterium]